MLIAFCTLLASLQFIVYYQALCSYVGTMQDKMVYWKLFVIKLYISYNDSYIIPIFF